MEIKIRPAQVEDIENAVHLLADTMAEFGVMTMGVGNLEKELRALRTWFVRSGNRFSHEFCKLATMDGQVVGLLLTLRGDRLSRLERALADGALKIYTLPQVLRMLWRLMVLGRTDEAAQDEYLISHVATFPEFRRQGIASMLLAEAEKEARELCFTRLVLEVEINNTGAINTYKKYGFSTVRKTEFRRRAKILGCPGYYKMLKVL
jgi:ribosomal protein S18 acetylase RimI-like enzyme